MNLLNFLIFVPLLAVAAIFFGAPARTTALGAAALNLALSLAVLAGFNSQLSGFQFDFQIPILAEFDFKYALGVDGLSLVLLLLSTVVTFAALWVAPKQVDSPRGYFSCLLLISSGAIGAFVSTDLLFFYMFHELALIPTFLLIGIWGTGERQAAAWRITIYLALGSFILLAGLLGLYYSLPDGQQTLDIPRLLEYAKSGLLPAERQNILFLLLLIGFGILVSLFPFHSWAPPAYSSAPIPAAMLHAGVLKKFGLYGLLRVAMPMLPQGAQHWSNLLLLLLLGNILYVGLATIGQKRLDLTLGYSSVMHMGYIFLGIASLNALGTGGAALLMLAHGLSIALLFALAGEIRQRTGTLEYSELGGLAKSAPFLGIAFGMAAFASIGLPGFANFAGEILVFFGAFKNGLPFAAMNAFQITTILALWGVVISAVYMLRAYRSIFMGDTASRCNGTTDCNGLQRLPILLLIAALLLTGFFPNLVLDLLDSTLKPFATIHASAK